MRHAKTNGPKEAPGAGVDSDGVKATGAAPGPDGNAGHAPGPDWVSPGVEGVASGTDSVVPGTVAPGYAGNISEPAATVPGPESPTVPIPEGTAPVSEGTPTAPAPGHAPGPAGIIPGAASVAPGPQGDVPPGPDGVASNADGSQVATGFSADAPNGPETPDAIEDDDDDEKPPMKLWKKIVIGVAIFLAVVIVATAMSLLFYTRQLQSNIATIEDPFPKDNVEAPRPVKTKPDTVNILVLGSDARLSTTQNGVLNQRGNRSDAIMIVQLTGDRLGANVMSIPRDSWVDIPGHGKGKINWAYSFGGAPLAIQTIENLTGIRIDHVVMADFNSFTTLTDQLGGVEMITTAGAKTYNGPEALRFVRERYNLPGGDFDRMRRQQVWMLAIAKKVLSRDVLTDPSKMNDLLQTVTSSIATDPDFTVNKMGKLGFSMRDVSIVNIKFMTAPYTGTGMAGDQSVVWLDEPALADLSKAWVDDRVGEWVENHPDSVRTLDKGPIH